MLDLCFASISYWKTFKKNIISSINGCKLLFYCGTTNFLNRMYNISRSIIFYKFRLVTKNYSFLLFCGPVNVIVRKSKLDLFPIFTRNQVFFLLRVKLIEPPSNNHLTVLELSSASLFQFVFNFKWRSDWTVFWQLNYLFSFQFFELASFPKFFNNSNI